jgi:hypothetical protein
MNYAMSVIDDTYGVVNHAMSVVNDTFSVIYYTKRNIDYIPARINYSISILDSYLLRLHSFFYLIILAKTPRHCRQVLADSFALQSLPAGSRAISIVAGFACPVKGRAALLYGPQEESL